MTKIFKSLGHFVHLKMNLFKGAFGVMIVVCLLLLIGGPCVYRVEASSGSIVSFPDANLQAVVREAINKPTGDIYQSDLASLTILHANNKGISNLEGLEYCTNLTWLDISTNEITDISPLSDLVNLQNVSLNNNQISNISALANLTNLTYLDASWNQIANLSPLSNLNNLQNLFLNNNQISDLSALSNLTELTYLNVSWNQVTDVSPLSGLVNLQNLFLNNNEISDISALSNLTEITYLYLNSNKINGISSLSTLVNLRALNLGDNQIRDLSALSNLTALTYLDASWNQATDLSPLSNLINLQNLFLNNNEITNISAVSDLTDLTYLYLNYNQISDISALSALANLQVLNLGYNLISNYSALTNLTELTYLYLNSNQINDASNLLNLINLQYLNLDNNQMSNVSALRNMTKLVYLDLGYNHHLNDISPIANLTNLQHLSLGNNQIIDISALSNLISLQYLDLDNNLISNISSLVNNHGLDSGDAVDLSYNNLDINSGAQNMSDIQTLISRGVIVTYQPQNGVTQIPTTAALSTSNEPSTYGQSVIFTASISSIPDSGTVQFQDNGSNIGSPVIINSSGRATCAISTLSAGSHTIKALYSGDANFASSIATINQTVYRASTNTVFISSANPSIYGQPVTFTANVNPIPDGGTIQFQDNGLDIGSPPTLNAYGQATFTDSVLAVGAHTITEVYSGDANFIGSNSNSITETITQVPTATVLTSSPNPSGANQSVTFTATVSPVPDGGTIQFEDNGNNLAEPFSVNASGQATYATSALSVGTHTITAIYSGDTNFLSSSGTVMQANNIPNWDINEDGICNYLDLSLLGLHWGETGTPGWIREDVNDDGVVNYLDLTILGLYYGYTW